MGWFDNDKEEEEKQKQAALDPAAMDPSVKNYMVQKYGLDKKYKDAEDDANSHNKRAGYAEAFNTLFQGSNTDSKFYDGIKRDNAAKVARADSDRKDLGQQFQMQRTLKDWEGKDKDSAEERDPNSMRSQMARSTAMKFGADRMIPADKLATMSAADINKSMPFLKDAYETDMRKKQFSESVAARNQSHADAVAQRNQITADKKAEKMDELAVPGFQLGGTVKPGKTEAKDARDALATFNDLSSNLDDLHALVKENGSFEWGGDGGTKMGGLATDIRLQLKQLAKLGVLSVTDYALLDKQISDPTAFKQMFTRDGSALTQIEQLKELSARKFANGMTSKGYRPGDEMTARLTPNQKKASGASGQWDTAIAAPPSKPTHEMTEEEVDAELKALGK